MQAVLRIPLALLDDHPANPQIHDADQITALRSSLREFGQTKPILVKQRDTGRFTTITGHGVARAARAEQWEALDGIECPGTWTEEQIRYYVAADNKLGLLSYTDNVKLLDILQERKDAGQDMLTLGINEREYLRLFEHVHRDVRDALTLPPERIEENIIELPRTSDVKHVGSDGTVWGETQVEKLNTYEATNLRQIVLVLMKEQYDEFLPKVAAIRAYHQYDTNTAVFLHVIDVYLSQHPEVAEGIKHAS